MDQPPLSSDSVLKSLLKTNRPPTNQETAIIRESMAPTNEKLKVVEAQISDTVAHIQALKAQVDQAEIKLQRLRQEEAAIWETFADHRRVFSPFRNLPEDILREICVACAEVDMPSLSYCSTPLPYRLAQISSGMRHVALTTPFIWSSMNVYIDPDMAYYKRLDKPDYSILARTVREWLERSGQLALTVVIRDATASTAYSWLRNVQTDPSNVLFDALLSYSARWKEIQFHSSRDVQSAAMTRIAELTAIDVPLLQSISLCLGGYVSGPVFYNSPLLTIPTIRHITLDADHIQEFNVNWAFLTSVTLGGNFYRRFYSRNGTFHYRSAIARILQKTKCLEFCDIVVCPDRSEEHYVDKIALPFLKTLFINEDLNDPSAASSILDIITAPNLAIFHVRGMLLDLSLANFFKQSQCIQELSLPYLRKDESFSDTIGLLRHCPSLTALSLQPCQWNKGTQPSKRDADSLLRAFVEEGGIGITCPLLQHFAFTGKIQFSLETLRLFLETKQGKVATLNALLPWKRVAFNIRGIEDQEMHQQMLDLVSQKKAAGLDVDIFVNEESRLKDYRLCC
ncbi:hypothetical protein HYPSUDRAFT_199914 [Hypholoma sublateritium FD-334 SS-4]|uniref:F-box domain-containing protein n=1 Tax=Hypholoma sublateritium (strain FD-334 SS-4) TaxID=945553 RepID=A0A0D2LDB0_HYPSF|nr:hypothetical protein HYPSUDRAFT_199914 [Hypholoma sublateritium FD-334 SS-4]